MSLNNFNLIRPTILVLIGRLIVLELLIIVFYSLLVSPKFFFGETLDPNLLLNWSFGGWLSFLLLSLFQTIMAVFITLNYTNEYYLIKQHDIVHRRGVFFTKEETFSLKNVEAFTVDQGLIGKLFNFGEIKFYSPVLKKDYILDSVNDPVNLKNEIEQIVEGLKYAPSGEVIIPIKSR